LYIGAQQCHLGQKLACKIWYIKFRHQKTTKKVLECPRKRKHGKTPGRPGRAEMKKEWYLGHHVPQGSKD
jgi:hypothetical protein